MTPHPPANVRLPKRTAGVPPASSRGVSPRAGTGGETPPELAGAAAGATPPSPPPAPASLFRSLSGSDAAKSRHGKNFRTVGVGPDGGSRRAVPDRHSVALGGYWFFRSAPPTTITMTSGPEGSRFHTNAELYRLALARNGVKLVNLPSHGSLDNLRRLSDPSFIVDVGFVQGGLTNVVASSVSTTAAKASPALRPPAATATTAPDTLPLMSLGSVSYQALLVFYRTETPVHLRSDFSGKRVSIGPPGSGVHSLALTLLATNGIVPGGPTTFVEHDPEESAAALLAGKLDALFLMGDSASSALMRKLLRTPGIQLLDFRQADAYTRRFPFLNKLEMPAGALDFGRNIPTNTVRLIAPTVELLARTDLHPALSDLLLEAAREIHGRTTVLQRRGEFPAPLEHEYPLSDDALRFYKTGKTFPYRNLPFWLASLVNRILVVLVPTIVLLIPGLRLIPFLYRWRIKLRLYHWYRARLALERNLFLELSPEKITESLTRLEEIEQGVNAMKLPASFADQFYDLRGHINFVRLRLREKARTTGGDQAVGARPAERV